MPATSATPFVTMRSLPRRPPRHPLVAKAIAGSGALKRWKRSLVPCPVSARCGEGWPRSEMPVLKEEQGFPAPGALERTLLDHA